MSEPGLYIADLAAYNSGHLHGIWIDATDDIEDIKGAVKTMLDNSPVSDAEEFAIHDYEGFEGYEISEYQGIESAHDIACFIEQHGKMGAALLAHYGDDVEFAQQTINDDYYGCYSSTADFAEEHTEQIIKIPKPLEFYIDYDSMARDWEMGGDIFTIETAHDELHIFYNH